MCPQTICCIKKCDVPVRKRFPARIGRRITSSHKLNSFQLYPGLIDWTIETIVLYHLPQERNHPLSTWYQSTKTLDEKLGTGKKVQGVEKTEGRPWVVPTLLYIQTHHGAIYKRTMALCTKKCCYVQTHHSAAQTRHGLHGVQSKHTMVLCSAYFRNYTMSRRQHDFFDPIEHKINNVYCDWLSIRCNFSCPDAEGRVISYVVRDAKVRRLAIILKLRGGF